MTAAITAASLSPQDQQRLVDAAVRNVPGLIARDVDLSALVAKQLTKPELASMSAEAIDAAGKDGRLLGLFAGIPAFAAQAPEAEPWEKNPTSPEPGSTMNRHGGNDGAPLGFGAPQLTRDDVKRLLSEGKYAEIEAARRDGRLAKIMGLPAVIDTTPAPQQ